MNFPDIEVQISSARELSAVLRLAKQCLANGSLRQVTPVNAPFATADLAAIPDEGPWPDYFEAHFEDRRSKRFKLAVETFHGAGGSWTRG